MEAKILGNIKTLDRYSLNNGIYGRPDIFAENDIYNSFRFNGLNISFSDIFADENKNG